MGLSDSEVTDLRARLRQDGVEKFFEDTINAGMSPRKLGVVFGLDPEMNIDESSFLRLLGLSVVRAFYKRRKLPEYNSIDDAAKLLRESNKIMVITGAGISTSLGIPDFRSTGTGFYAKVQAMKRPDISEPQDVFDIEIFDEDPQLFYELAGDILPDLSKGYSPTHGFIRLLQDMKKLQTNYTQNIDNLEELAQLDSDKVIQCHGSFANATCRKCKHKVKGSDIYDDIRSKRVARCKKCIEELSQEKPLQQKPQKRRRPGYSEDDDDNEDDDIPEPGVMKPDITFFGEQLPQDFFSRFTEQDAKSTDLVIVIGTSLKVAPVSEMPNHLPHHVPHIYISMEPIKHVEFDIQLLGKCDDVVVELCNRAGWELKHDKVNPDARFEVLPAHGHPHVSLVRPETRTVKDSQEEEEVDLTAIGSSNRVTEEDEVKAMGPNGAVLTTTVAEEPSHPIVVPTTSNVDEQKQPRETIDLT